MTLPPASASYSVANEQSFRATLGRLLEIVIRRDVTVGFVLMTDTVTGETGKLTIVSGAPTWTAL